MATPESTALTVSPREAGGSRTARRLRRAGEVPGVVYGGGQDPVSFSVPERTLRHALADAGAVMELSVEGGASTPVVVKDIARHPVTGAMMHIDLLRVRLDVKINATVQLELTGAEEAEGVKLGGVLEQPLRELNIEALPNDIPDSVTHDVTDMQIGDTLLVEALTLPVGVTLLDDPETVVATLTPPRLQAEAEEEIESETEVVGEGEAPAETGGAAAESAPAESE